MILANVLFILMVRCAVAIVLSMILVAAAIGLIHLTSLLWSVFDTVEQCAVLVMVLILLVISYHKEFKSS